MHYVLFILLWKQQPSAKSSEKDLAASATSALPATDDSVRAKEPSQTDQETSGYVTTHKETFTVLVLFS